MDFYELLDRVIELLQREGRVSYRVPNRQFSLDDDFVEDLKEELIYSKRLAVDEDSRVAAATTHLSTAYTWFKNLQVPRWVEKTEQLAGKYGVTLQEVELEALTEGDI